MVIINQNQKKLIGLFIQIYNINNGKKTLRIILECISYTILKLSQADNWFIVCIWPESYQHLYH